ncbi:MAG: Hsp20 family protein [Alphaproteobacteria bacterium]
MTRVSVFDSPLLLGFDHFERMVERISKTSGDGYPPYNIEQVSDTRLRITLAVAGFTTDDLAVGIEDNQLIIRGKQEDDTERTYLYRGIAARQFQRAFVLAEGIEITGATLEDGLLHVDVVRPLQEPKSRTVEIRTAGGGAERLSGTGKAKKAS